jgi:hypothetical protein
MAFPVILLARKLALCGTYGKGPALGRYRPIFACHKVEKSPLKAFPKAAAVDT